MKTYFCAKTFNSERDKDGLPLSHPQYLDFCLAKIWLWQPLRDRVPGWGPHAAVGRPGWGRGGLCWETCFRENGLNKPVLCIGVLRCPLQTLRPPFSP